MKQFVSTGPEADKRCGCHSRFLTISRWWVFLRQNLTKSWNLACSELLKYQNIGNIIYHDMNKKLVVLIPMQFVQAFPVYIAKWNPINIEWESPHSDLSIMLFTNEVTTNCTLVLSQFQFSNKHQGNHKLFYMSFCNINPIDFKINIRTTCLLLSHILIHNYVYKHCIRGPVQFI